VFVTALYTFRMIFLVFHGPERMDSETRSHLRESPWVVTLPLVLLAIPSVLIGWFTEEPMLFGNWFGEAIQVRGDNPLDALAEYGTDPWHFLLHGITASPTFLSAAGLLTAWWLYLLKPGIPATIADRAGALYGLLKNNYYFDDFNEKVFAAGARSTGQALWRIGDQGVIDGALVNGSARFVGWLSGVTRRIQTGYLYHYAFAMFIGLAVMLGWLLIRA
jgi:NADH-quinone oxidoreductase subunit L